eukprot:7381229-Prorocentrum_lima.AAC.1
MHVICGITGGCGSGGLLRCRRGDADDSLCTPLSSLGSWREPWMEKMQLLLLFSEAQNLGLQMDGVCNWSYPT